MTGHVSKGFGVIRVSDLRTASSLKALLSVFGQPFAPIDGQANLELTRFKIIGDSPSAIEGSLLITRPACTLALAPVVLCDSPAAINTHVTALLAPVPSLASPI